MSEKFDFEKYWLAKFSKCLEETTGSEIRKEVMKGSESFSQNTNQEDVISWSKKAMEKLDTLVDEKKRIEIMTGCACQYSKSQLEEIKKKYEETKDINIAYEMLQEQFESLLKDTLKLNDELIDDIVNRGWGSAGVWNKEANTIIAKKIPKSSYILEYFNEKDPEKKRQLYCHCPRVREALKLSVKLSPTYCYCGAGFYKGIWEEILQKPVEVEVLESVLQGDDVCKIAIHLPKTL